MNWTPDDLKQHAQRDALLGKPAAAPKPALSLTAPAPQVDPVKGAVYAFTSRQLPIGKPRMTQRDTWKKRPIVLRYREFCDRLRADAGHLPDNVYGIDIRAFFPVTDSWSKKKKLALNGTLMQQRPDYDNIAKAVGDALFKEDSILGGGSCWKYWCQKGEERVEVRVLYGGA